MLKTPRYFLAITFCSLFVSVNAFAEKNVSKTPTDLPENPMKVGIGIYVNSISEIDEIKQTFKVDGYLYASWTDKRLLPLAKGATEKNPKVYSQEGATEILGKEIWWPVLEFINISGQRETPNLTLEIYPDGRAQYSERFMATLNSSMYLRKFPFDRQTFRIEIEPYDYHSDLLQLFPDGRKATAKGGLSNSEWEITSMVPETRTFVYDDKPDDNYSRFSLTINAERKYGFYLWKIFLPLFLIVGVSFVVFWVSDISIQVGTVQTILLTVVAFNFIISGMLPRISYITFIDSIINTCYIIICLALVEVVIFYKVKKNGNDNAMKLMSHAKWVFPLGFLVAVLTEVLLFL